MRPWVWPHTVVYINQVWRLLPYNFSIWEVEVGRVRSSRSSSDTWWVRGQPATYEILIRRKWRGGGGRREGRRRKRKGKEEEEEKNKSYKRKRNGIYSYFLEEILVESRRLGSQIFTFSLCFEIAKWANGKSKKSCSYFCLTLLAHFSHSVKD